MKGYLLARASKKTDSWVLFCCCFFFSQTFSNVLLLWCYWTLVDGSLLFSFSLFSFSGWCPPAESMHGRLSTLDLSPQSSPGRRCEWGLGCYGPPRELCCPRGTSVPSGRRRLAAAVWTLASLIVPAETLWPSTPKVVFFFHLNDRTLFFFWSLIFLPEQSFSRNQSLSIAGGRYESLGWMLELCSALRAEFVPDYLKPLYLHQRLNQRFLLYLWRILPSGIHAHSTRSLAAA